MVDVVTTSGEMGHEIHRHKSVRTDRTEYITPSRGRGYTTNTHLASEARTNHCLLLPNAYIGRYLPCTDHAASRPIALPGRSWSAAPLLVAGGLRFILAWPTGCDGFGEQLLPPPKWRRCLVR